jgi:hypothetical protein
MATTTIPREQSGNGTPVRRRLGLPDMETLYVCDHMSEVVLAQLRALHRGAVVCKVSRPLLRLSIYDPALGAVQTATSNLSVRLVVVTDFCGPFTSAMRRRGTTVDSQEAFAQRLLSSLIPEGSRLEIAFERISLDESTSLSLADRTARGTRRITRSPRRPHRHSAATRYPYIR